MKIILGAFRVSPKFKNEVWDISVSERGGLGDIVQLSWKLLPKYIMKGDWYIRFFERSCN